MFAEIPWEEIQVDQITPSMADTQYFVRLTHIPTGTVVSDVGPSPYRLKRELLAKLTLEVRHGDSDR